MSEEQARRSHGARPREDGPLPRADGPPPGETVPPDKTGRQNPTAGAGETARGDTGRPNATAPAGETRRADTGRPNQTARPSAAAEPAGLPPFDAWGLLRWQLAEADEPWELSAAEIAALPRAGDAPPPELDEVPWWLSEEFTGTDAEQEAAFVRSLPADIRAEYAAGPWTGAGEAWGAGFVHHDEVAGPRSDGFAAGGEHDILAPGPELAAAAAAAAARPRELGESELIGVLCGWQRLVSWAHAGQTGCLNELVRRRKDQSEQLKRPSLAAHVDDEVAAALALTGQAAGRLLGVAVALGRWPVVAGALAAGEIDWVKAGLFADYLAGIPDADAGDIAAAVLRGAGRKTSGQLRAALVRAVLAYDPDSAQRRREDARKDASVQVWQEPSGNAGLAGRELAAADALHASARLTACARWLRDHGAVGSVDQLRAAALIALLTDQALESLLPPAAGDSAAGDSAAGDSAAGDSAAGDGAADDGAADDSSAAAASADGGSKFDGAAGSERASGGEGARESDGNGAPGRPAAGPQLTGSINLTMPMSAWLGQSGSPGELSGYGPADAATCAELAGRAGLSARWCLTLTDAAGRAVAHACAGHAPPPGPGAITWARGLRDKLEVLESGTCSHARRAGGYCPPRSLRNLVCVRQRRCSFPGCRRPAVRCDLDHTVPYDAGGATCECNLAPLCRRHHQAKQAPGWHLTQPQPGEMLWRLPSGRKYPTCPDPYPI